MTVTVSAAQIEEGRCRLHFAVSDSGIGMSKQQQRIIFEAFMQADSSTTRRFGGTGLGLTISQRLVQLMGSDGITVESEEGRGSTFSFELPLELAADALESSLPVAQQTRQTNETPVIGMENLLKGRRVLVVDDQPANCLVLGVMLKELGATVAEVHSGAAALQWLEQEHAGEGVPDLILMDLRMPEMGGVETATAIHQRYPELALPIFAMSAESHEEGDSALQEAGMTAFLHKPIDPDRLEQLLLELFYPRVSGVTVARRGAQPPLQEHAPEPAEGDLTQLALDAALVRGIQQQLGEQFRQVQRTRDVDMIGEFAETLRLLAEQQGASPVVQWATGLAAQAEHMDVVGMSALPELFLPRSPLGQVVVNLVKNSLESISERIEHGDLAADAGQIRIEITLDEGEGEGEGGERYWWLEVVDNGVGLTAEQCSQAILTGYTTKLGRSGLGLHHAANFSISVGGRLTLESGGKGAGATVRLKLPVECRQNCYQLAADR